MAEKDRSANQLADGDLALEDFGSSIESQYTNSPQSMDINTFKQRNDPAELLMRYRMQLMNAYPIRIDTVDDETGRKSSKMVVRRKKDGKGNPLPMLCNKKGVEEIISYIEKFINNHVVQGNIETQNEYRNRMRYISNDITVHFITKRQDWDIKLTDTDLIISNTINIVDLFLTRTLFNEERRAYGETYKETTNRELKTQEKPNIFQRVGGALGKAFQ